MKQCWYCHEASVSLKGDVFEGHFECAQCQKSRTADSNVHGIRTYTHQNGMDPYCREASSIPEWHNLPPKPTEIEEMMFCRSFPVMKIIRLENGTTAFKGCVVNYDQEVQDLANVLPHLPEHLPVFRVARNNPNSNAPPTQYKVRRHVIEAWLAFLTQHNPLYNDVTIDDERFNQIPEDGNVFNQFRTIRAPKPAARRRLNDDEDEESTPAESDRVNGPEQGGASGPTDEEFSQDVEDNHVEARAIPVNLNDQIERNLQQCYGTSENPVQWPRQNNILNEYQTPHLQAMTFPSLFPFGTGDATNKDHMYTVDMKASNKHLLNYGIPSADGDGTLHFPFAEHTR